jgi:hypothetical protein
LFCLNVVHSLKYCSTQAFICSICPSIHGWNAIDRFCWIPRFLHNILEKFDVKWGSQLKMIYLGVLNQGTRCFRYSLATPGSSIILLHGMNLAALEHLSLAPGMRLACTPREPG